MSKMTGWLIVSEKWRWDKNTDELINIGSEPPTRHRASDFEAKVAVYAARVREWFLDVARDQVANGKSAADYVAVSIGLAYIEGVEQYRQGKSSKSRSRKWFKSSAKRIFPAVPEDAIERLYENARCGLFHCGFTDGRTYLSHDYSQAIALNQDELQINPSLFIKAIDSDFTDYVKALLDSNDRELRHRFEKLWDQRWENS
jgi:hypothetical protein